MSAQHGPLEQREVWGSEGKEDLLGAGEVISAWQIPLEISKATAQGTPSLPGKNV